MILILDFGSQFTQLIARRIRSFGVYTEIHPCTASMDSYAELDPTGIILSGGPDSVYDADAPKCDDRIFSWGKPILGICYGWQYTVNYFGGGVEKGEKGEYGGTEINITADHSVLSGVDSSTMVWMSHADKVNKLPPGFATLASSNHSPHAVAVNEEKRFLGLQFHPEVRHTKQGEVILKNFISQFCNDPKDWSLKSFRDEKIDHIRQAVGSSSVICAVSGGVDSSVTAKLIYEAVPEQLYSIFIDNGLLREGESEYVKEQMNKHLGGNFHFVDASERFLQKLEGVSDPEKKRKIIGNEFIRVFEEEAAKIPNAKFLAQGTLYPDVIESTSFRGPSATIKSHHNVGGLPEQMGLDLLEPLRELFKDEVRELGTEIGLPPELLHRHPFPGPGLAIRIPGEVTKKKIALLRAADSILREEIQAAGVYDDIWQALVVLLPVRSVGVMGDFRTYDFPVSIRCVTSHDAMTADWYRMSYDLMAKLSSRIVNEVKGINRVLYDITSKPPGTVEWE